MATTPAPCANGSPATDSTDAVIQRRGTKEPGKKQPVRLGLRWIVEATNTWWSNYGQLRRNTDRRTRHRHAALCLATVVLDHRQTHHLARPLEPDLTHLSAQVYLKADRCARR